MITVVFGGASSGKSEIAENIAMSQGQNRLYIATMIPYSNEGKKRVAKHLNKRCGKGFSTIERYVDLENISIERCDVALLECVGNLLANEMYEVDGDKKNAVNRIVNGIKKLGNLVDNLVIVTNDVFKSVANYSDESAQYVENFAIITRELFEIADTVLEIKCGIPLILKGENI
ncbi:MAG: bifunctional adenosylcobinamide kinase/adenosylcobinamide-phosphate guanylyltransferase [Clostridia bacterium]